MARQDQQKALHRFRESLENLTFNSKPLIDDLTRAAEACKSQAPEIVEIIESRIMQARTDWKLPSLYLLDSIMKNLRGVYQDEISKIIVSVFCHCFEKLAEPEHRKALHKLRCTWTPYVPMRKLAAIDRHVHALDPNWPVQATDDSGPPSPTIFVNPKFLEGTSGTSGKAKRSSPPREGDRKVTTSAVSKIPKVDKTMKRIPKISKSRSPSKSPEKSVSVARKEEETLPLSIRDKRRQILMQVKSDKMVAMGLSTMTEEGEKKLTKTKRSLSPNPISSRRAHSKTPQRPRSTSPVVMEDNAHKNNKRTPKGGIPVDRRKHLKPQETTPPPEKRIKLESAKINDEERKPVPLKEAHLNLDDIPPELLPKHQERLKKQLEDHLASGNLSTERHEAVVQQLEKLYELQELKKNNGDGGAPPDDDKRSQSQPRVQPKEGLQTQPRLPGDGPGGAFATSNSSSRPEHLGERDRPDFHSRGRMPRGRDARSRPPTHLLPTPFETYPPPNDRDFPPPHGRPPHEYYRGRHPRHRRGDFIPPRGRECIGWRRGRYFGDAPQRGRSRALPGPPPPGWPEPMEQNGPLPPPHIHRPPSHGHPLHGPPLPPPRPMPPMGPPPPSEGEPNVSELLDKLVSAGLIGGEGAPPPLSGPPPPPGPTAAGGRITPPLQPRQTPPPPPVSVPHLSFTPATLKQRYSILITLLHSGVPCTSCGLRFKSESAEDYRHHLDWHYQVNRKEREGSARTARNWYMHPEDWLKFEELAHDSSENELSLEPLLPDKDFREKSEQPSEHDQISCRVLPGETSDEVCSVCQEPLEQFWEENEEEWHFKDAMRNDSGKLFHVFCYKDAKESGALDTSGTQLPSPVEVKEADSVPSA